MSSFFEESQSFYGIPSFLFFQGQPISGYKDSNTAGQVISSSSRRFTAFLM